MSYFIKTEELDEVIYELKLVILERIILNTASKEAMFHYYLTKLRELTKFGHPL